MENELDLVRPEDSGVLKFNVDMTVDTFLDQYMIWRMRDTLRFEEDTKVRQACEELLAYMSVNPIGDDDE
jgi:hypothetical protein